MYSSRYQTCGYLSLDITSNCKSTTGGHGLPYIVIRPLSAPSTDGRIGIPKRVVEPTMLDGWRVGNEPKAVSRSDQRSVSNTSCLCQACWIQSGDWVVRDKSVEIVVSGSESR